MSGRIAIRVPKSVMLVLGTRRNRNGHGFGTICAQASGGDYQAGLYFL